MTAEPQEYLSLLRAVINARQKAVDTLRGVAKKYDELQATLTRSTRQSARLAIAIESLQSRAEATVHRLDEIESEIDRGFLRVTELQYDQFTSQNQILNAMNATQDKSLKASELAERLQLSEAKLGMS